MATAAATFPRGQIVSVGSAIGDAWPGTGQRDSVLMAVVARTFFVARATTGTAGRTTPLALGRATVAFIVTYILGFFVWLVAMFGGI